MRKGSDLSRLPVIAFDTGEEFERVEDLIFDRQANNLLALLVDEGGWFRDRSIIAFGDIQSIGPDAVIVASKDVKVNSSQYPEIDEILDTGNRIKGLKLITTDGRDLGSIVDLYFDEQTGKVEGYEVSGGVFADAYSGRSFVPAYETLQIGSDVAFVPPEVADLMEEQVGGMSAAMQSTDTPIQDALGIPTVDEAKGLRVQRSVRTDQGLILAAAGQIVTDHVIERARTYGRERDLLDAVGLSSGDASYTQATGTTPSEEGVEIRETASGLWQSMKERLNEMQDRAAVEAEEQRIKYALGRPVNRVILDPQDNVILNVGELITHKAIETARLAGVLDVLLNSVYDKEPELRTEDLRAPTQGDASLEQQSKTNL